MIQTIHIGRVLRETATAPYSDLVTRPTGMAVRNRLLSILSGSPPDGLAFLDFSAVRLIDFSCADEVVAKLVMTDSSGSYLCLMRVTEDQADAIHQVLLRHELAVVAWQQETLLPTILGLACDDQHRAFRLVYQTGGATVAQAATSLDWTMEHAARILTTLCRRRLAKPGEFGTVPLVTR